MLPQKRLRALQDKSVLINARVEQAEKSPYPDPTMLRKLKKQKLELKEIIFGLRPDVTTSSNATDNHG